MATPVDTKRPDHDEKPGHRRDQAEEEEVEKFSAEEEAARTPPPMSNLDLIS